MKETELKSIIKEVVRECITEVAPPGAKAERMVKHVKSSLRQSHPDWDEKKIKQVAYATAWDRLGENAVKEAGLTSEKEEKVKEAGLTSEGYDEGEEIKLIKGLNLITKKLLDMHAGMDAKKHEEEEHVDEGGAQYKQVSPNQTDTAIEDKAREIQYDPKVSEAKMRFREGLKQIQKMTERVIAESNGGPQYKVVSPNQTDTAKEDKAREIQRDPKVNEEIGQGTVVDMLTTMSPQLLKALQAAKAEGDTKTAQDIAVLLKDIQALRKGTATDWSNVPSAESPMAESNHKVQHRSHKTIQDVDQDPENVRDPKVPQA